MFKESCPVVANRKVAPGHFVMTLKSSRIAKEAKPGEFVQILCDDSSDPLLPRPFSYLSVEKDRFSILYQVVGKGTAILQKKIKGDVLSILGSCGQGFTLGKSRLATAEQADLKLFMVGGGVGIPPLHHWTAELVKNKFPKKNIHIFLGARDKSLLLCEKEFKKLGVNLHLATDNGSKGHKGYVTEVLNSWFQRSTAGDAQASRPVPSRIFTCGPTPMMKAVSAIAEKFSIPCQVSVEVPMACGFGACLGCAVAVKEGDSHRYAIACCEGPVFDGAKIIWN